ncbi:SH3 domain-containing protein [Aggregatilinea lenta]|uniref:SH3 domain-containing protein n=1 Tax=Aggregatilinea lenta TaxID=913108 RepID=UPI000E5AD685|nr:SH3 domain-containing protein [Aggregatilinea lenta]
MSRFARRGLPGLVACVILLLALPIVPGAPAAHAQNGCDGLIAPRLTPGGAGRVSSSLGVSLKNVPATSAGGATELATLPTDTVFTVLDGPQCNQGYAWWQIQLPSGVTGWAAEGNATDYFLEPTTIGLYTYRRSPDATTVTRFFVTPDGAARQEAVFTVPPLDATPASAWQQVELDTLTQGLTDVAQNCPERFVGTPWADEAARTDPTNVALPVLDYTIYPAPAGDRLLLVRSLMLPLPRCVTALPDEAGMTRVTLLAEDGTETELFPFPQHGTIPASQDRYALSEPDAPRVYLDEIKWSPDGGYIAFVVAYRDTCEDADCYRFQMYVYNTGSGQLYVPGEGRHVAWANNGAQLLAFRLLAEGDTQRGHLYSMNPDGTGRQEVWLPGGAVYLSSTQTALGFPWNAGGTRVLIGNGGTEQVMMLNIVDRGLTSPAAVPDIAAPLNRLSVDFVKGDSALLWTTIRGQFVLQDVRSGEAVRLTSEVASTGVPLREVRPFSTGLHVLLEMSNGTAYVLDLTADRLTQVVFGG